MNEKGEALSRLQGIDAKVVRAEEHLDALEKFPPSWSAREKPYVLRPEIDQRKRRYIWHLCVVKPIPPLPAVLMDEVTHHLRSVLDHLAAHLVESSGSKPTQATCWPIEGSHWGWKRNVERRRHGWQRWRKGRGGPLGGIPFGSAIWTFIESTQPYKRGGKAREDPLFSLNESWNRNKHRILNPLWFQATTLLGDDPRPLFSVLANFEPIESRWIIRPGQKIEDGAKIALFRFPKEMPLPTMEVKVEPKFPIQIATGDKKGPTVCLQETLELIRGIVAEAKVLATPSVGQSACHASRTIPPVKG